LSYEELEQLADQNGVGGVYQRLVSGLEEYLQKQTTRSSIAFAAMFDKSRKTVLSLLPGESSQDTGLRFQVYLQRFMTVFGLSKDHALEVLPKRRESWKYYETAGADYSGFQGYIASSEVEQFLEALAQREVLS
jgi:hypothetical protein